MPTVNEVMNRPSYCPYCGAGHSASYHFGNYYGPTLYQVMNRLIMRELELRERALQDADIQDQIERVLATRSLSQMAGGAES